MQQQQNKYTKEYTKPQPNTEQIITDRVPPQAVDIEKSVLASALGNEVVLDAVMEQATEEHFYARQNRLIYEAMFRLYQRDSSVDIIILIEELRKMEKLENIGGETFISELANSTATTSNISHYMEILDQKKILRELIHESSDITTSCFDTDANAKEVLDTAEARIFGLSDSTTKNKPVMIGTMLGDTFKMIEKLANTGGITGLQTGFTQLDELTTGFHPGELIIIAARPGMGKCLGKGTKVVMFDGTLKKVEDIQVGDLLMGDDSTPRKVESLARGREQMYWIRQNRGIDYRVNESHILSLKKSREEGKDPKGSILNISVKEYLEKSDKFKSNYKGYRVPITFIDQPTEIEPYFLGLWLGDGNSDSIGITTVDNEVITYLEEYSQQLNLSLQRYETEDRVTQYAITKGCREGDQKTDTSLQAKLQKLNLLRNKHIPHSFIQNSTENRLQLLAGLIDSDGYYSAEYNVFEVVQKREKLAKQIKYLADTLGFQVSLVAKKATIADRNYESDVYRVCISGELDKIPTKIARKQARKRESIKESTHTGIVVEKDIVDDYYGFTIDGNHLFLLEDMTVTHNTAFVLSLALNASIRTQNSEPIVVFSLEMPKEQLVQRMLCSEAEIDMHALRGGYITSEDHTKLGEAAGKLYKAPLYIDDSGALNPMELRAKCRRIKSAHDGKLGIIIIDYLQLMHGVGKQESRQIEISTISRTLKEISKELRVPVIALSQLSRAVEQRSGDNRPQLSDLRESGAIEQDADIVLFLYRKAYYLKVANQVDTDEYKQCENTAEVIISKQRNGGQGTIPLSFIGKYTRFDNLDTAHQEMETPSF